MNDLSAMIPLLAAVLLGLGLSLVDSDDARRELRRHRLVRIASLQNGAARIDGRVVPADNPAAPAGTQVAQVSTASMSTTAQSGPPSIDGEQRFLIDDGSGQALVVVPPPPPKPLPGDDPDYEILCSFSGNSGGAICVGDQVSIGGYASLIVDPTGDAPSYRGPPTRFMLTATRYYPLLIVRR